LPSAAKCEDEQNSSESRSSGTSIPTFYASLPMRMCEECDFIFSSLNAMPVTSLNGWMNWILPEYLQVADGRMDLSSQVEIHSLNAEAFEAEDLEVRTEDIRSAILEY
jgi:hypothetical protein